MAYGGLNKEMDAAAELGRNPVISIRARFSLSMEMSGLRRVGTAEPVSLEEDWQPYPVDPYSADSIDMGTL